MNWGTLVAIGFCLFSAWIKSEQEKQKKEYKKLEEEQRNLFL